MYKYTVKGSSNDYVSGTSERDNFADAKLRAMGLLEVMSERFCAIHASVVVYRDGVACWGAEWCSREQAIICNKILNSERYLGTSGNYSVMSQEVLDQYNEDEGVQE
jgi:hypothetical protein